MRPVQPDDPQGARGRPRYALLPRLPAPVSAALSAFGLVFVAELGDKSMLLVLTLAARYRWWVVLIAISVSAAVLMALAVALGSVAGELLPPEVVGVAAGLLFIGFGVVSLRGAGDTEDEEEIATEARGRSRLVVIGLLTGAFVLAEFGDKTQVATLSLAGVESASPPRLWLGATLGLVAADAVALAAGGVIARHVPAQLLARVAGVLFIAFGLITIGLALR
ncbi:MAG: UPF0016 domain-containing protein [Dehalococcoidia bacterium]|nr:UPF0016 domain-containing protein [Dehalococcoidia bacterium]